MTNKLDKFVENLRKEIIQKELKDHNERIVKLFYKHQNWGKPPKEEITIFEEKRDKKRGYCLGLYLKIKNNIIIKANFITDGCGVMVAVVSQLPVTVTGKSIKFAKNLNADNLNDALNGIPPNEIYCIDLTIKTLKSAIIKYKDVK